MARATTGAREGRYYWEAKILSGIRADPLDGDPRGHVRLGFARREAQLDGPVGFDAYSYGLRDVSGQKVHMSRPKDFANGDFVEGDVIGLEICLPSFSLHKKVAEGTYNKAVDVSDDLDPVAAHEYLDIIRDRVPIRFKNTLYFGKPLSCLILLQCLTYFYWFVSLASSIVYSFLRKRIAADMNILQNSMNTLIRNRWKT